MPFSLTELLIGRPVGNREAEGRKLGVLTGLPAMGLDGLGSAAYGPEAALTILAATGAAGLAQIGPVTWAILILLAVLFFSYWQTIAAYPSSGGSYVVAKENLGTNAGLLAAAALMVDYMLNVAVGISAGVGALTSAVPALHRETLWICLGILAALTLANLRGTRESGLAWAVPTYLFIGCLGFVLIWGTCKMVGGHPQPVVAPPAVAHGTAAVSLWLLLRAFASGCTAMTGVEAVSNGVNSFAEPRVPHARATLAAIVGILGLLLLGIAHLAHGYGIMAMDEAKPAYQSVLSQLLGAVYGRGWFYYVAIGSVLAVLCLSANTSFVAFPQLCHLVARDGFLPRPFALPGRRLVYTVGILFLAAGAGGLIAAFGGITDRLIPLFAVGAFLSFTLSQSGMAAHWLREGAGNRAARGKLAINGLGAVATAAALIIILAAKFVEGAWLTVLVIPATILLLRAVRRYYDEIDRQVLRGSQRQIDLRHHELPSVVLVPLKGWNRLARKAIEYALRVSPEVIAMHVMDLEGPDAQERQDKFRADWAEFVARPAERAGLKPPELQFVGSEFRSMTAPLLREIEAAEQRFPGRPVTVILPELIEGRWWGFLMHAHRERRLRARLLRHGGQRLIVALVPWQLQPSDPAQAIAEDEPTAPQSEKEKPRSLENVPAGN